MKRVLSAAAIVVALVAAVVCFTAVWILKSQLPCRPLSESSSSLALWERVRVRAAMLVSSRACADATPNKALIPTFSRREKEQYLPVGVNEKTRRRDGC